MTNRVPQPPGSQDPTNRSPKAFPGPLGYMLITTFAVSLIPFSVHMTQGSEAPFLFNMWLKVGVAGGCATFLLAHRTPLLGTQSLRKVARNALTWPANAGILLAVIGSTDFALFAWSTAFIQIPAAVIIFGMHPIGLIITTSWLFRKTARYQKLTTSLGFPILLCAVGLVFANASQVEHLSDLNPGFLWKSLLGMTILTAAVASTSFTVFGIHWGVSLSRELSQGDGPKIPELHSAVLALVIINLASAPISLVPTLLAHQSMEYQDALIALATGFTANAVASIAWRKFTIATTNLGTTAVEFGAPVLSIIWLYWVANVRVARWDYLAIGALGIILANLLITFKRDTA